VFSVASFVLSDIVLSLGRVKGTTPCEHPFFFYARNAARDPHNMRPRVHERVRVHDHNQVFVGVGAYKPLRRYALPH